MKYFKRSLSFLLCCVLLSVGCSVYVHAESDDSLFGETPYPDGILDLIPNPIKPPMMFSAGAGDTVTNEGLAFTVGTIFNRNTQAWGTTDFVLGSTGHLTKPYSTAVNWDMLNYIGFRFTISSTTGSVLFPKGSEVSLRIESFNAYHYFAIDDQGELIMSGNTMLRKPDSKQLAFLYTDGTYEYINDPDAEKSWSVQRNLYNYTFVFTPNKDVEKLFYIEEYNAYGAGWNDYENTREQFYTAVYDYENLNITYEIASKEEGLLASILNFIRQIKDGISDMFAKIGDIFTAIIELPSKLWQLIENGLKNLFVPDEDYMVSYRDKWDTLLSDRFGAVYQVSAYMVELFNGISVSDATNTIAFPIVTLNLPDDTVFSFGGWDVRIVPEGFDFLAESCKLIVGIISTLAFMSGLMKKYDELMGVEK